MVPEVPAPIPPPIDWEQLARSLGAIKSDGGTCGGSDLALQAIEEIIGPADLIAAVDYYVDRRPGAELARSVLWMLRPWVAMQRCHELSGTNYEPDCRRSAVELLRVVADRRALPWVRAYLDDLDEGVQTWGAGIVDQILWSHLVEPEECAELLEIMSNHPNDRVRESAEWIRSFLKERENDARSE